MLAAIMIFPMLVTGNMAVEKGLSNAEVMQLLQMPAAESFYEPVAPTQ
jgi:hypothetical protein